MDFWGVQVPPNKPVSYRPSDNQFIHVSHAALGEGKWGNDGIIVRVKSSGKDIVLGTLAQNRCDQMKLDLIFMQEFELSHNGKGTVHIAGYTTQTGYHSHDSEDSFSEEEEDISEWPPALVKLANRGAANRAAESAAKPGVVDAKENKEKTPAKQNGKPADKAAPKTTPAVKPSTPKSEDDEDESDDDSMDMDDEDESDESDDLSDEDESDEDGSDDDDEEDESDSEDEPQKVEDKSGKKRAAEKNLATPPTGKKIKTGTPASGKKGKEIPAQKQAATPTGKKGEGKQTPAAKSAQPKTPSTDKKGKKDAPGSDGKGSAVKSSQYHCQECSRNFANEAALTMHNQAKHK